MKLVTEIRHLNLLTLIDEAGVFLVGKLAQFTPVKYPIPSPPAPLGAIFSPVAN